MELEISRQLAEAAVAAAIGIAAGIVYDALRVIRSYLRAASVTLAADILFGLLFGIAIFLAGLTVGRGRQRIFMVALAMCGGGLYFCTVSRIVLMLFNTAAEALSFVLQCLSLPFVWVYTLIKKIYLFSENLFKKLKERYIIKHHGRESALFRRKKHCRPFKGVTVYESETGRSFNENSDNGVSCIRGHYAYRPAFQNRNGRN